MAIYMIQTEDRINYKPISFCVKNKETALTVARFVTKAMWGSCESYDCDEALAKYNRANYAENEHRFGDVVVTELEVVG